jgi:carbon storage regulator
MAPTRQEGVTAMLVLRRKAGEAIVLNGVITIHVLAVEGERVKLGISAPPEVVIVRSELLENQGQLGGSGPMSPGGQSGPRPYRDPEREANGSRPDLPPSEAQFRAPPSVGRYGPRRLPGDDAPESPVGNGPLHIP